MLKSHQSILESLKVGANQKPKVGIAVSFLLHICLLMVFMVSLLQYNNNDNSLYAPIYIELYNDVLPENTNAEYSHSNLTSSATNEYKLKEQVVVKKEKKRDGKSNYGISLSKHLTKAMLSLKDSYVLANHTILVKLQKNGEVIDYGFRQKVTHQVRTALHNVIDKANPFPRPPANELENGYVQYALKLR